MATGAYDANGIWQYGEDDNIALFSDLLNLATESTSDAFTDDRARIATLEAGSLSGLIPVSPSSVVVATGTAAANTLGVVTFTGASSISLNGVFTSAYKNYKFILHYTAISAAGTGIYFRYRASGSDNSAAGSYFRTGRYSQTNATGAESTSNGDTSGYFLDAHSTSPNGFATGDIIAPNVTTKTLMAETSYGYAGGWNTGNFYAHKHNVDYSADGITIYTGTGTFTGTIQILGYND